MSDFNFFLPIAKVDTERRIVSGYASTPAKDSDGEIIELAAVKKALPGYLEYGNIREMHKLNAVGVAAETNLDKKGLYLSAYIADDAAWAKCKPTTLPDGTVLPPVYKGFSIGGRKLAKDGNKVTAIDMTEISVVDRPANPECKIDIAKSKKTAAPEAGGFLLKVKEKISPEAKALAKMSKIVSGLAKAGPPAAHDGFSLPAKTTAKAENGAEPETEVKAAALACEKHGKIGCKKCAIVKRMSEKCAKHDKVGCSDCAYAKADKTSESSKPYGDVEYADEGLRADGKHRYPIDSEEHIRAAWNYINKPKNSAKYGENAAKVKAKIVAAWKKRIHKDGPPGAEAKAGVGKATAALPFGLPEANFLTLGVKPAALGKSMRAVGTLSYVFDSLREAQRSLLLEGKREGGDAKDKALALALGEVAEKIAGVIGQKASHEGAEAKTLTDADDSYLTSILGEDFAMAQEGGSLNQAAGGDPLASAILDMVKKAAQPTRMQRMEMADDNVKKSRKAMKMAKEAIEEAHKMHKAAYLSKASKAEKGKSAESSEDFDHSGAMEKLYKAYEEVEKALTFGKAARVQLSKAAARSGQNGQEVSDAEGKFYEVPPGVKALTPAMLAGASPGGNESDSQPPMYPTDGGVFPGKAAGLGDLQKYAKNGQVSAEVVQLMMEKAAAQGELEALRRMPASAVGGARPRSFDPSAVLAGTGGAASMTLNKALFDGVNVGAIGGEDERQHTEATAKVIGNFLTNGGFGKSLFDPSFRGAAGSK